MFLAEIDTKKIPGKMNDRVKLHSYLSPGDLMVLWNSFKIACTLFSPEAAADTVRITNDLCGFWKTMLDKAYDAVEAGEYPCEFVITFCRGDFFIVVLVMDRLLRPKKSTVAWRPGTRTERKPIFGQTSQGGWASACRQKEDDQSRH